MTLRAGALCQQRNPCFYSIGTTILMRKRPFAVRTQDGLEVVIWVVHHVAVRAVTYLKVDNVFLSPVDQLMGNAPRRKTGTHSGGEADLPSVGDERWFTLQNVYELILPAMLVQQRRFAARRQPGEIYAKALETEEVAQRSLFALGHSAEERFRIVRWPPARRRSLSHDCERSWHPAVVHLLSLLCAS